MTRVDFYVLPGHDPHVRRVTACKLIEKAYRQGHRLFLKTDTPEETRQLDDLLWTFRQGSFVPHEVQGPDNAEAPVIIGHDPPTAGQCAVLVNLGHGVPAGFDVFERVAELVDQEESTRLAGRERYKIYQQAGCVMQKHQLDRA